MALPERSADAVTVLGTAACVVDDISKYGIVGDVLTLNHAAPFIDTVYHAVSMHWAEWEPSLAGLRRAFRRPRVGWLHAYRRQPQQQDLADSVAVWRATSPEFAPAGSGHLGVLVALSLGYVKIRLLGVPMNQSPHFYDLYGSTTAPGYADWVASRWRLAASQASRIRSASGVTRSVYGGL